MVKLSTAAVDESGRINAQSRAVYRDCQTIMGVTGRLFWNKSITSGRPFRL